MELTIISSETIKPSTKPTRLLKTNLSLFDQLTPTTYPEILLFFPTHEGNSDVEKTLTNLKKALSDTLTIFYPLSGRTKENQYIGELGSGVPFVSARANLRLSDFFDEINKDNALLNKLVLFQPFRKETESSYALMGFQVTLFSCGGICVGTSVCHKVCDGSTLSRFLKTWAAIFSGNPHREQLPNYTRAAELFPPLKDFPEKTTAVMNQLWFMKSSYATRRFYFSRESVEVIKALARSEAVPSPTRNEAVGCFIWKHCMVASWRASGSSAQKTSVAAHAVNLRPRMKARARELSECTGNLFWFAGVASSTGPEEDIQLRSLVELMRAIMKDYDEEYLEGMVGPDGFEPISEFLDQLDAMLSVEEDKADVIGFTNWKDFFGSVDFGWGKPVWVGAHGEVGEECRNIIVLIDKPGNGKEIEVFVTLETKLMDELERDDKFLAFAVPPLIPVSNDHQLIKSRL